MRTVQGKEIEDRIEALKGHMKGLRFLFDGPKLKQLIDSAASTHNRCKDYERMTDDEVEWWITWCEEVAREKRKANAI